MSDGQGSGIPVLLDQFGRPLRTETIEPEQTQVDPGAQTLDLCRRGFLLKATGAVATWGVTTALLSAFFTDFLAGRRQIKSRQYERELHIQGLLERFRRHLKVFELNEAEPVAAELQQITELAPRDLISVVNNHACVHVWMGNLEPAACNLEALYMRRIPIDLNRSERIIVASNLAWVRYHLGYKGIYADKLLNDVLQGVECTDATNNDCSHLVQLWSRRPNDAQHAVVPTYALIARLHSSLASRAKEVATARDHMQKAFCALLEEVWHEGPKAFGTQGARLGIGFIAPSLDETSLALRLLKKMDPSSGPSARQAHMVDEREFLLRLMEGRSKDGGDSLFVAQAQGILAEYYAYCGVANVRTYLCGSHAWARHTASEFSAAVKWAYGEAGKGDLAVLRWL